MSMELQWYPGHMTKARRGMEEMLKLVDVIVEVLDARMPESSRNPDIVRMGSGKSRVIILGKADLADEARTKKWKDRFISEGIGCISIDSRNTGAVSQVRSLIKEAGKARRERDLKRGIKNRPVRVMIAGIPNVGKSTIINSLAMRSVAKTGNKPGVTRGNQWISMKDNVDLLDTPGILWPKFEDPEVGMKMAFIGSMNDANIHLEELCCHLIDFLTEDYPGFLSDRYGVEETGIFGDLNKALELLQDIAVKRNCIGKGQEPDTGRMSKMLLDDYRAGRLGRITLDRPQSLDN